MNGTFVPTYQGLSALDFVRRTPAERTLCYPFNASDRLPFYRARNAIYYLFRALVERTPGLTVLAPDYNSGNEILAMRAAGARIRYCPVNRQMQMDPDVVERLCMEHEPDVLYVIHYIGWPQPMPALEQLARRRGMPLIEDCALSLLSESDGRSLGSTGDWSIFCLYKTLPLPNGALLTQNTTKLPELRQVRLRNAGSASVLGRTAELLVQHIRGRANGVGAALQLVKRGMGRAAGAMDMRRANVGDIGFDMDDVDLAMSGVSIRLLERMDFDDIRRRRAENYRQLDDQLDSSIPRVFPELPEGVCPLFFPILVDDKASAARALQRRGIDALEFWNDSSDSGAEMGSAARFLRSHVLELPIHQDLTARHIAHIARGVSVLSGRSRLGFSQPRVRTDVRVECVETAAQLAALRPQWTDLLQASTNDRPFLTWEWLYAWWLHLSGTAGLKVMTVYDGEELIAVAPFRLAPHRLPAFSSLEFLGTGHAGSDYLDLIVRNGREEEALGALAGFVKRLNLTVRLDHLPERSLALRLAAHLSPDGWVASLTLDGICPVIPLAGHTWDSYLSTLGSAHRANVRRRLRAVEREFDVRFEQVTSEAGRSAALAALAAYHDRRFETDGGSTAFMTPAVNAFQNEATRLALEAGWLRMYVLRLDDRVAAVMYGFLYNERFYFYQHGFDDAFARHSAGLVVMALTIRAALDEGAKEFDLLWGTEPYKALWARTTHALRCIHLYPPRAAGRLHLRIADTRRRLSRFARRVMPTGGSS